MSHLKLQLGTVRFRESEVTPNFTFNNQTSILMKILTTTILLFCITFSSAQSNYEKAMTKGLELLQTDLQAASQHYERITAAEKENWLPPYYAALANINSSWGQFSKEQTIASMKKAQEFIDKATALSPNNPEIMVLQGLVNTCYIKYDSSIYGMKLSGSTTAIYEKAMTIEPNNPRVVSSRAQWLMGSARFFNKDVQPYCNDLKQSIALFEMEKPAGFKPKWGKDGALNALKDCK